MADETVALDLKIQAAQSAKSVSELKQSLKDLKNAVLEAEAAGNKALANTYRKAAGEAADKLGDLNQQVKNLASDTKRLDAFVGIGQGIAGGFAAAQGAAALFGASNKELEKTLLKVQGSMALLQGVQQVTNTLNKDSAASMFILRNATLAYNVVVGTSTGLLKAFKLALAGTGVGLLVIGLIQLVQNFDKVKKALENIIPGFKAFTEFVGNAVTAVKNFIGLGDELKTTTNQNNTALGKFADKIDGITKSYSKELSDKQKAFNEELKKHNEYLQKLSEAGSVGSIGYYNFLLSESTSRLNKLVPGTKAYNDELAKNLQLNKQIAEAQEAALLAGKKQRGDVEIAPLVAKPIQPIEQQPETPELLQLKQQPTIHQQILDGQLKFQDLSYQQYLQYVAQRKAAGAAAGQDEINTAQQIRDAKLSIAQSGFDSINALGSLFISNQQKLEAFQKKAAGIQILIDTAKAIGSTIAGAAKAAEAGGPAAPFLLVTYIASGLATVLTNIAKAKQLLSQAGASSSGTPSLSGVTGGGAPTAPQPIQIQSTNLSDKNNGGKGAEPQRVYVLESDITKTQGRVSVLEERAKIH